MNYDKTHVFMISLYLPHLIPLSEGDLVKDLPFPQDHIVVLKLGWRTHY